MSPRDACLAALARPLWAARPHVRAIALGCAEVREALCLRPFGVPVSFVDAADAPELVARYHAVNLQRFGGPVALPGWVLADLYLLPAAITILEEDGAILAAYYAAPSLVPGEVVGVSLLSCQEGIGAGTAAKAVGLGVLGASVARGATQWRSRALRVHARFGDLIVEGPPPAVHGLAAESFRYRTTLGVIGEGPGLPIPVEDALARVARGERLCLAAPGGDGARVWIRESSPPRA